MNASWGRTLPSSREMPAISFPGYLVGREDQEEIHLGNKEEIIAHSYQCCLSTHLPLFWQWKPSISAYPQSGSQNTPPKN